MVKLMKQFMLLPFLQKENRKLLIINFIKLLSHFLRKIGKKKSLISCCFLLFFKITMELLQRFQLFYAFFLLLSCQSLTLSTLLISKHAIGVMILALLGTRFLFNLRETQPQKLHPHKERKRKCLIFKMQGPNERDAYCPHPVKE